MNPSEQLNKLTASLSRYSGMFIDRLRNSWKTVAVIVVVLLGSSVAFLIYALQDHPVVPPAPTADAPLQASSTVPQLGRALDGVIVDASSTQLLPLAVMVENSADAWPLEGPAKADVVFEAPAEGGITRFMLVFDASTTVAEIGPVRSARPYYVEWADGVHALYAHVGGSPDALSKIDGMKSFRDLNEFYNGWAFWRSAKRAAPHNVYTSTENLLKAALQKEYRSAPFTSWKYADATSTPATTSTSAEQTTKIKVPYDGYYAAEWRYDQASNEYMRYQNGSQQHDADGTEVRVKNVVLLSTEASVLDDKLRLQMRTTGKGKALVFQNGGKREAIWTRTAGEHIRFAGVDGTDILFERGKTWISVITGVDAFKSVSSQ